MKIDNTSRLRTEDILAGASIALAVTLLFWLSWPSNALAEKQAPNDVKGWRETIWGMSPSELKQARIDGLKEHCKEDKGTCIYTVEGFELYGAPFNVYIYWAEGVNSVSVILDASYVITDQTELAGKIETGLRAKYGRPRVLEDKREHTEPWNIGNGAMAPGFNTLKLQWVFPSTTITYEQGIAKMLLDNSMSFVSQISIEYQANDLSKL